ncbi:chlorite dismutase family protein [Rhizobium acaciae]|uniref:chlorite dismutase family protein n=1 Tax=Rhizobium acaciae TaxID=2989736 RepID=UPI003F948745
MVTSTLFIAGDEGQWRVDTIRAIRGANLAIASHLEVTAGNDAFTRPLSVWRLRGVISSLRYTNKSERDRLQEMQSSLDRSGAFCAALIPIKKSDVWWSLAQDERRAIVEEQSSHFQIGMDYLPAVARQLYHSRDLGESFDFLTWFEFPEESAPQFDELLKRLRATEEWRYVEREVEVRLTRASSKKKHANWERA